jgi:hypothetical protein
MCPPLFKQSKQSLSEVENLYYKHRKGAASSSMPGPSASAASSGPQISPSTLRKTSIPTTPKLQSRGPGPASSSTRNQPSNHESDVFGGGLMTPPASGNTFPVHADNESFAAHPSLHAGLMAHQQRSPTMGLDGKGAATNNKGRSYADFWSKIGTAPGGSTTQVTDRQ